MIITTQQQKGSNDSNYSGPSSGGDLSYEESDRNLINKPAAKISSETQPNRHRSQQAKSQQPQQRNQDAKQEIELCRVRNQFLKSHPKNFNI